MSIERVTIKDLSEKLKISVSTVYRALHNAPDVSLKTREAVLKLAEELNYEPDPIAQGLVKKQSKLIGVMVPTIQSNYFSQALSGMTDVADEAGYHVIFYQSNENENQEKAGINKLIACHVDGLLISVSKDTKTTIPFDKIKSKGVAVVMYDRVVSDFECTKVIVDEFKGAYEAVSYLIKKGCKRIAHIAGPQNLSVCANRLRGYKTALSDHGLKVKPALIAQTKTFEQNALKAIKAVMDQIPQPDGLFLVNDLSAVIALRYLKKNGLCVPKDIQVIGFNDDPVCTATEPTISTVMQPGYEVGKLAMGLLLEEVQNKSSKKETHQLRTKLVLRGSTK